MVLCRDYLYPHLQVMLKAEGYTMVERSIEKKDILRTKQAEWTFSNLFLRIHFEFSQIEL